MPFNDLVFLLLFLPAVLVIGLFVLRGSSRIWFIGGASLVFYGFSGPVHSLVLALCILWVFLLTKGRSIRGNPVLLGLAILGPLACLLYFKYAGFLSEITGLPLVWRQTGSTDSFDLFDNVLLPAGISFFSIQLIGYAVDRYRGEVPAPVLARFFVFVSFFPQLIAGPIVRFNQVRAALEALGKYRSNATDFSVGLRYVVIGLLWKVILADGIAQHTTPLAAMPDTIGLSGFLYLVPAYSMQLYFDFYGYSLIAIGLGYFFGFKLPVNFARPYSALNPKDFWRRWHISLSYWIRDYIYLPLGGNRRYAINILLVFGLCGLWHGAGYSFLIWGILHGILVALYGGTARFWDRLPVLVQGCLTLVLISLGWQLFLFDLSSLTLVVSSFSSPGAQISVNMLVPVLVAIICCFFIRPENWAEADPKRFPALTGAAYALLFALTLLFIDRSGTFIYFRF